MLRGSSVLLARSLRLDAFLLRAHVLRLIFAGVIFLSLAWAHLTRFAFGSPGLHFFRSICWLNLLFISLAGISLFATPITEEKEEGTLGLLKLAGLSPLSLLLGKSTTRLISATLLLMAQLPFTLLAITLGGVTMGQIAAAYFALLAYMLLVANSGLLCSIVCKRSSNACLLNGLIILLLQVLPISVLPLLTSLAIAPSIRDPWNVLEPVIKILESLNRVSLPQRLETILLTGFSESPLSPQVGINVLLSAGLFVICWMTFDRLTRYEQASEPSRNWLKPGRRFWGTVRVNRAWKNPIVWKEYYFLTGGPMGTIARLVALIVLCVGTSLGWCFLTDRYNYESVGVIAMLVAVALLTFELSFYASRIFHDELRWHTFPTLTLLPMSTSRIVFSKLVGCALGLIPAVVVCCIGITFAPAVFAESFNSPEAWGILVLFLLFLHLTALFTLGVKRGALPLALAVLTFFSFCCFSWMAWIPFLIVRSLAGSDEAVIMPIIYFGAVLIAVLQVLISRGLEKVKSR